MSAYPPAMYAQAPQVAPPFPHYRVAQDHAARTQRLIEMKLRQMENSRIEDVKAHDLADLIKATKTEVLLGKKMDTQA